MHILKISILFCIFSWYLFFYYLSLFQSWIRLFLSRKKSQKSKKGSWPPCLFSISRNRVSALILNDLKNIWTIILDSEMISSSFETKQYSNCWKNHRFLIALLVKITGYFITRIYLKHRCPMISEDLSH